MDPLRQFGASLGGMAVAQRRAVLDDFHAARRQAALQDLLAKLTGQSARLLSFDEVRRQLRLSGGAEHGVKLIPIAAIVGSVGRYSDFTRTFLPRRDSDEERWARVRSAAAGPEPISLPPIEVYKVGEVYFVLDGNHRVSVARRIGLHHIEARVIEIPTPVPLTPDVRPDELILKAEYAQFLELTGLARAKPPGDMNLTEPGGFTRLSAFIQAHQVKLSEARGEPVTLVEAAAAWYRDVYLPTAALIRDSGLLQGFPNRTETDLYLWVSEHQLALENELGWSIQPVAALEDLSATTNAHARAAALQPGYWRRARLIERYTQHLFANILVLISDTPEGWRALEQAVVIAQREEAQLAGLHVVTSECQHHRAEIQALQERFRQRCAAAGVTGQLAVEQGAVVAKVRERARLADLVVLSLDHPPPAGLSSLGSGIRAIIWGCNRPLLVVPGPVTPLRRAILAYDGSAKAREALFLAAYLAEAWQTHLTVMALEDGLRVTGSALEFPRAYLELHELNAEFEVAHGTVDVFRQAVAAREADVLLMGGYSVPPVKEVLGGGSAVNFILRDVGCPQFICR
jgi:nucleotide-binding universal stress UspA family protein